VITSGLRGFKSARMPFSKRIVSPQRIGRLSPAEKQTIEDAGEFLAVSHCAMVGLLQQLTSVTKHADGIFSDLYEECRVVLTRTDAIRKRCDTLASTVEKFNHKTEKIRKFSYNFCLHLLYLLSPPYIVMSLARSTVLMDDGLEAADSFVYITGPVIVHIYIQLKLHTCLMPGA
jgi:hypothetical protein